MRICAKTDIIKSQMNRVRVFLLKGKEDMIDHVKSVKELGCCYWKKAANKRLQIGDICYLFLSGKGHNQIRYRLIVEEVSCQREDKNCWKIPYKEDFDCYKLVPTSKMYSGDKLSREKLEDIGISRYVQFKELNNNQADFLDKFF